MLQKYDLQDVANLILGVYYVQHPDKFSSRNYGYELGFLAALIQKEGGVSDKLAKMCRRLAMCYLNSDEPEKA